MKFLTAVNLALDTLAGIVFGWKRDSLEQGVPYMPASVIEWLEKHLSKEMNVFEWGSGGSTIFIAERAKSIVSIEYGQRWYYRLLFHLKIKRINNCVLKLILPEHSGEEIYRSQGKYGNLYFEKFVKSIDTYPDGSFDMVIVDGRCRSQCILHARSKVKKGGYLIVDDADRPEYISSIASLTEFSHSMCDRTAILQRK